MKTANPGTPHWNTGVRVSHRNSIPVDKMVSLHFKIFVKLNKGFYLMMHILYEFSHYLSELKQSTYYISFVENMFH